MKKKTAALLLMVCISGLASAQTDDAQPAPTKQIRTSKSQAKQRAAEYAAKAGPPQIADESQSAPVASGCSANTAPAEGSTTSKPEANSAASQNVVEYGGGGF